MKKNHSGGPVFPAPSPAGNQRPPGFGSGLPEAVNRRDAIKMAGSRDFGKK